MNGLVGQTIWVQHSNIRVPTCNTVAENLDFWRFQNRIECKFISQQPERWDFFTYPRYALANFWVKMCEILLKNTKEKNQAD